MAAKLSEAIEAARDSRSLVTVVVLVGFSIPARR